LPPAKIVAFCWLGTCEVRALKRRDPKIPPSVNDERSESGRLVDHGIGERADIFDFDAHAIASLEPEGIGFDRHADALRGASQDDSAGDEGGAAAEVFDDRRDIEDHVAGGPILHAFAVEDRGNLEGIRIRDVFRSDEAGTERRKGIEELATAPLAAAEFDLVIAGGNIIGTGVAEHVVERIFTADVFAGFADHDREFAFVVHFVAGEMCRDLDGIIRILRGIDALDEKDGTLGNFGSGFGGVFGVVQADAEDLRRLDWGEQLAGFNDVLGDLMDAVNIAGDFECGTIGLECGIGRTLNSEVTYDFHEAPLASRFCLGGASPRRFFFRARLGAGDRSGRGIVGRNATGRRNRSKRRLR